MLTDMEILKQKCDEAVNALIDKRIKIATAESCTGGLISSLITSVSGGSAVFGLGICSYSPTAKHEVLKVSQLTLDAFGTVSEQTAKEMAENVRKIANADIGVSVTGVAGPNMSENKPVGLVYIALSDKNTAIVKKLNIKPLGRDFVRNSTAEAIFDLIINYLNSEGNYAL